MVSLFPLKGTKKRKMISAVIAAFLLSTATCLFQNWGQSFISTGKFWQFLLWCGAFFIPAATIFAVDLQWIPAAVTACGAVATAIFGSAVRELWFCVSLPALLLLFAFRFFGFDSQKRLSVHPIYLAASAFFTGCTVWLAVRSSSEGLLSEYFWIRYSSFFYGFVALLVISAVYTAYLVLIYRSNRSDKKGKKCKKKNAGGNRPTGGNVSFWVLVFSVGLFLINVLLCFVLEDFCRKDYLPLPVITILTELLVLLSPIGANETVPEKDN